MKRQIVFAALYAAALTAHAQSINAYAADFVQTAAVAPGVYLGDLRASPGAEARPLDLTITASSADGHLWGYGESFADVRSCRKFPFEGVAKPDGTVELESKIDVVSGCERVFALNLRLGNRLTGAVWGPGGKFEVRLTRLTPSRVAGAAEVPYGYDWD